MQTRFRPGLSFKDNLQHLPPVDAVARIHLRDGTGAIVASIENEAGKQGSLAVYHYVQQQFGALDAAAADYALLLFGEHVPDARSRPGAHPNIDRLFAIVDGGAPLTIEVVPVSG